MGTITLCGAGESSCSDYDEAIYGNGSNTLTTQVEPPAQEAIMKVMVAVLILTEGSPTAILAPFR